MCDEQLLCEARNGSADALDTLLHRFKQMVKIKASAYFLIGGDRDDLIQEGMIGLYKAIRDYDPEKKLSFYAFAELCASRQIMTAIKASARQKHLPLNNSLSINSPAEMETVTAGCAEDPETLLISREELDDFGSFLQQHLSEMEYQVLSLHLQGRRHADIAQVMGKKIKSVDNTLQRIRKKMGKVITQARQG